MEKKVRWIELDESTDIREVRGTGMATIDAVISGDLQGWNGDTHTVMATHVPSPADKERGKLGSPYSHPAHVELTDEEAASLPKVSSVKDYCERFENF